jgi:uncharacterized protein (TIGR02284 family)
MDRNMMALITTLTDLAELCREGERGFRAAAGVIKDTGAKIELYNFSQDCRNFYMQLQIELRHFEGTPVSSEVRTSADLSYFNLTSTLVDRDTDPEIIAATDRAVEAFKRNYETALKCPLTEGVLAVVQNQYNTILRWAAFIDALASNARLANSR